MRFISASSAFNAVSPMEGRAIEAVAVVGRVFGSTKTNFFVCNILLSRSE
jgi:hypothetical protein